MSPELEVLREGMLVSRRHWRSRPQQMRIRTGLVDQRPMGLVELARVTCLTDARPDMAAGMMLLVST